MNWKRVESTEQPGELDTVSSQVFNYVRKNITETEREGVTMYEYDELAVSKDDWMLFSSISDSEGRIDDVEDAIIELAEMIGG